MRIAIVVIVIVVAVIFLGGTVNIGQGPVFWHIDRLLGTSVLMDVHRSAFFFLYSAGEAVESEMEPVESGLKGFQERPAGIDKKKKYKDIEDAAK